MRLRRLTELDPNFAHVVRALGLSAAVLAGCSAADAPAAGAEGGVCVQGQCLGELQCNSDNICVGPDGGGAATVGGGAKGGDGDSSDGDSGSGITGGGATDGGGCYDGDGNAIEGNEPPVIEELTVEGTAVTSEDENVRVTIKVSDPDGLDDIRGARIESASGRTITTLGQVSSDTFSAEIDWYYDISYNLDDDLLGLSIEFQATVFDNGCNDATSPFTLLVCEEGESECDGACVPTRFNDENCGACGHQCAQSQYCDYGTCEEDYAVVDFDPDLSALPGEPEIGAHPIEVGSEDISLSFGEVAPTSAAVEVDAFAL